MKKIVPVALIFMAGCAAPLPYTPPTIDSGIAPPPSETRTVPAPTENKTTNTLSRDASDCERQAALSTAGSKAEAFNNCMKARRPPN